MFNFIKRIFRKKEYVLLVRHDGGRPKTEAYQMGENWYSHPYLPDTRCKLLPGGKVKGQCYIHEWEPATPNMLEYYKSDQ